MLIYLDDDTESHGVLGDHTVSIGRVERAVVQDASTEPLSFFRSEWNSVGTGTPDA